MWFDPRVTDLAASHDDLRPLMFSIAYRMLGSVAEAEDVVQDAFLRMHRSSLGRGESDATGWDSPDAYAATVTTRLAIDALRSARRRRERYVGPWLPEPLLGPAETTDPARRVEIDETLSMAFLVVLERLSPLERAVFVLREALGYEYAEIARVVGRSEGACRQLLARARRHIDEDRPRFAPTTEQHRALFERFLTAVRDGDVYGLEQLLAEEVTVYGDGGGKAPAAQSPVHGSVRAARFLVGLARRSLALGVRLEPTTANGQPAALAVGPDGALLGVLVADIADGRVTAVRNQINPDKLSHLGPVGDLAGLPGGAAPGPADPAP